MIIHKLADNLQKHLKSYKSKNKKIGFVPTMGALHEGHASLIKKSKSFCDVTVCSIFVNPTQFNNQTDFDKYPRTIESDILLLEKYKTDFLFLPAYNEIYSSAIDDTKYTIGDIEHILEGKFRPGHFQGVCQAVDHLLRIVQPSVLFLGMKDYQQFIVMSKMIYFLNMPVTIELCPTLREEDGLAMSSRNVRLNENDRKKASGLYEALLYIKNNIKSEDLNLIKAKAKEKILNSGFSDVDYVEICDTQTLSSMPKFISNHSVALAAATIDGVRLIDNLILT